MNRPCLLQHHSKIFNPPQLPETAEYEVMPEVCCAVSSGAPNTNTTPGQVIGPSSTASYLLLRFNLRGFKEANVRFTKVGLVFGNGGANLPTTTLTVGKVKNNFLAMTSGATYNTYDGTNPWTGSGGGFLDPATAVSWAPASMPGVTGAVAHESATQGTFPSRGSYHPYYDTNLPATLAALVNAALDEGGDTVSLYVYSSAVWQFSPGSSISNATDWTGVRLVVMEYDINPHLKWVGGDGGSIPGTNLGSREFAFPPMSAYASAGSAPNANSWGYPYFDMTSVDPANTSFNWHGGTSSPTNFANVIQSNGGTGASENCILMHFNLSAYIGRTFSKVRLRFYSNVSGTNQTMLVGQAAEGWTPGNGGGAASTSGPTWIRKEKTGSVNWAGGTNVGAAAFLDTTGQAETAATELTVALGGAGFGSGYEVDITAMANRALTNYLGHLYLRVRVTHTAGGGARSMAGPSGRATVQVAVGAGYSANTQTSNNVAVAGYRTFPHLRIRVSDPTT